MHVRMNFESFGEIFCGTKVYRIVWCTFFEACIVWTLLEPPSITRRSLKTVLDHKRIFSMTSVDHIKQFLVCYHTRYFYHI